MTERRIKLLGGSAGAVGMMLAGWISMAGAEEEHLRGPAFSDLTKQVAMPEEWVNKPIGYAPWAIKAKADVAITLDQQFYLLLGTQIEAYGAKKNLRIVNQEGTCGISDKMIRGKEVDLAAFCCAPGENERLTGLRHHTLGIASKAFIVHPDNPVSNLTVDQLQKIFQGQYARWSDVEGTTGLPNIPIHVVGWLHCKLRPGHWRLMLDNDKLFSHRMKEVVTIPDVITEVQSNPGSIGYETLTNIYDYQKPNGVKFLNVEGYDPRDLDAIANLRYPLYRTFAIATWDDPKLRNPHVDELVAFMQKELDSIGPEQGVVSVARLRKANWQFVGDEVVGEPPGYKPHGH